MQRAVLEAPSNAPIRILSQGSSFSVNFRFRLAGPGQVHLGGAGNGQGNNRGVPAGGFGSFQVPLLGHFGRGDVTCRGLNLRARCKCQRPLGFKI